MAITLPGIGVKVDSRTQSADSSERQTVNLSGLTIGFGSALTPATEGNDYQLLCDRAGVLFTLGGHPNVISRSHVVADSDGAQTNYALLSVSTGSKIVITQISAVCDAANTTNIVVRIGFGTASVPTPALAGTNGLLIDGVFGAGSGQQKGVGAGIIAAGADDEDLRLTCGDPVSGNLYIQYSYFTIAS